MTDQGDSELRAMFIVAAVVVSALVACAFTLKAGWW